MKTFHRVFALLSVAVLLFALTAPALATEDHSDDAETTETTVAPEPVFENGEPAVVIPPSEGTEDDQPWTARYIYPSLVIATAILLIGLVIYYNRSIRRKYKVVA